MIKLWKELKHFVKRRLRNAYISGIRRRNKNKDFTIISQNCLGGLIYSDLGLEFRSPTINMFIKGENFVKLATNPEYYFSIPATPLTDCYVEPDNKDFHYPKILVGDVELCCLHYKDCADAIKAWERRRARVNLDNIYVIANTWDLYNRRDLVDRLINEGKHKTIIFTTDDYPYKECFKLPGDYWHYNELGNLQPNMTDEIPNHYKRQFETFFDFTTWLNS